jgi:prepilin-type N-terminal cleavage/methylation domain-containing protein
MLRNRAFTLVEILMVMAVISLLSSITFTSLNTARAKARDAVRINDLQELRKALALYYS